MITFDAAIELAARRDQLRDRIRADQEELNQVNAEVTAAAISAISEVGAACVAGTVIRICYSDGETFSVAVASSGGWEIDGQDHSWKMFVDRFRSIPGITFDVVTPDQFAALRTMPDPEPLRDASGEVVTPSVYGYTHAYADQHGVKLTNDPDHPADARCPGCQAAASEGEDQ